jgi:hypothetical protein
MINHNNVDPPPARRRDLAATRAEHDQPPPANGTTPERAVPVGDLTVAESGPRFAARPRSVVEADIRRLNPDPDELFAAAHDDAALPGNAVARAEALVRGIMAVLFANPRPFRELEHLQLETSLRGGDAPGPVRRRMKWVDRALESAAAVVQPDVMRRLRLTLPLLFGTEALLTQLDICRSDAVEATDAMAWAARTLVQAALAEPAVS